MVFAGAAKKPKGFINPENLLRLIPVEPGMNVADFGCGSGHYAVAAATAVGSKGQVFALDILEDSLSQTMTLARLVGVRNLSTKLCDLEKIGSCPLPDTSIDLVIISSLLHQVVEKKNVIREAYRLLRTGGNLLIVEWTADSVFGPPAAERISRDEVRKLLEEFGFRPVKDILAGSFHYAFLYTK